jgi:SAM-dependent methyltransferase
MKSPVTQGRVSAGQTHHYESGCQNCGGQGLRIFYEALDVPVHNALVLPNRNDALTFPRGDVVLGFCDRCGFITNVAFDPHRLGYSTTYEEQQSFSPTFNAFAQRLATHLIEKFDVRDKDIVEIGCGKGDFLLLLCELGNNRGIGIDPTAIPARIRGSAAQRVTFVQEFYADVHASYPSDLLCCRHTLEHIAATAEFVRTIRRAIGDRLNTAVFFEVPDVLRVLREQAYWDIYYEHCSYFGPGSFARLFRANGFEVVDVSLDFDGQYVLLEARPTRGASLQLQPVEETVAEMARAVDDFSARVEAQLQHWRDHLHRLRAEGKRAVVWGSGSKCVSFLTTVGAESDIEYVVDVNPHRQGNFILGAGKEIMAPEFLKQYQPDEVIVMNAIYVKEIREMLDAMHVATDVLSV